MAAVADVQTVNITINDIDIAVPKGELIVEAVKRVGLEIPIFCYHPRMKPVGMCRMCLVEVGMKQPDGTVRKMPKPQAACTLPASEGLVIYTDTEMVHRDRKGVLEFLLINHPLDCPICDRGGECPLQNNTLFYGPSTSRYIENKRHAPKAFPLSKYVTLDLERCIQCGRCVRFTEEISGDSQLAFRFRGASMQPSTFELTEFESKFSGNVIEICPVGALTNAKYRFRARPWDLQTRPAVCLECGNGCNVWFDYRVNKMVRINGRTNEAVNEEWTCDKGKFGHDWYNAEDRITKPLLRWQGGLVPKTWTEAYDEILKALSGLKGSEMAALGGSKLSNEDAFILQKVFRQFGSNNLDHRFTTHLPKASERLEAKFGAALKPSPIASFENAKGILLFGVDLAAEQPIVFLRVRKAWFQNNAKVVVANTAPTDADKFASVVLRYKPGTEETLIGALANAAGVKGADARLTPESAAETTGVDAALIREAAEILKETSASILGSRSAYDLTNGPAVLDGLASLALGLESTFDAYARTAGEAAAERVGLLPDVLASGAAVAEPGLDTKGILEACANGSIKLLWLADVDLLNAYPDKDLVTRALENVEFLVLQSSVKTETAVYASVILPASAPAETTGTYTNIEGRVQSFRQVLPDAGEAKPIWKALEELALRKQPQSPLFNTADILDRLASENAAFAEAVQAGLEGEGHLLS